MASTGSEAASPSAHPSDPSLQGPKLRLTCDRCQEAKSRCSREKPCYRCKHQNIECTYSPSKRVGRPRASGNNNAATGADPDTRPQSKRHKKHGHSAAGSSLTESGPGSRLHETASSATAGSSSTSDRESVGFAASESYHMSSGRPLAGSDSSGLAAMGPEDFDMALPSLSEMELSASLFMDRPIHFLHPDDAAMFGLQDHYRSPFDHLARDPDPTFPNHQHQAGSEDDPLAAGGMLPQSHLHGIDGPSRMMPSSSSSSLPDPSAAARALAGSSDLDCGVDACLGEGYFLPNTQAFSGDGSTAASSPQCECYKLVLRRLLEFDEACTANGRNLSIDAVIRLEQTLREQTARILKCRACLQRPDLLMLLAMAMDGFIRLLESISCPSSGTSSPSRPGSSTGFGWLPNRGRSDGVNPATIRSSGFFTLFDSRALMAGAMEVSAVDKMNFLKQLMRRRLSSLCDILQQLQSMMAKAPQSHMTTTGMSLILEGRRRLNTVIGRLELLEDPD